MGTMMEQITLIAPDISCGHCLVIVKQAVGGLAGVQHVLADARSTHVEVVLDPLRVTLADVHAARNEPGYPAQPEGSAE
jgi:copper chaperone CopZ